MDLPENFCEGITFQVLPHPDNCTLFVVCMNEHSTVNECKEITPIFFDGNCVEGDPETCKIFTTTVETTEPVTTTTEQATTTEEITTTTEQVTTEQITTTELPLPDDFCQNKPNSVPQPHPYDCTKYIICMNEIPFINICQYPTAIFQNGICVEGDPASCEIFETTESFTTEDTPSITDELTTTIEVTITTTKSTTKTPKPTTTTRTTTSPNPSPPITILPRTTTVRTTTEFGDLPRIRMRLN